MTSSPEAGGIDSPTETDGERCALCGLPTPDPPVTGDDIEGAFCCRGCLEVTRTLGDTDSPDATALDSGPDTADVEGDTVFLDVDGMHCATCEAFLESRATGQEGVRAADASYATGLMKVVYDDATTDGDAIAGLLDGLGYRARPAGTEAEDEYETLGRLLVGGFFGMMTMVWYVLFLYPAYLGVPTADLLFDVTGPAGTYLLWNVWLTATIVLGYTGYPILRGAYVSLRAGRPNMDLLVALAATAAYAYSTGVLLVGGIDVYFDISVVVVLAVTIGGYYEDRVRARATDSLSAITEDRVTEARRRTTDGTEMVPLERLDRGDEVVVRPGERIPVDGTVVDGTAACDEALVTGESLPVRRGPGDEVVGGARVTDGALVVRADRGATSTADRLVSVLWELQSTRGGVQRLADRLAAVFVPLVLLLAAATFGWRLLAGTPPTDAFLTALAVLVVSCPCALGLATPLAIAAGVKSALDQGVIVTDASAFERAPSVDVVALDKTGTLTTGAMQVVDVATEDAARSDVLARAAAIEQFSDHPVADAIVAAADAAASDVEHFDPDAGRGVTATVADTHVVVGRTDLLTDHGMTIPVALAERYDDAHGAGRVPALVGWDGAARGVIVAGDQPRPGWDDVVSTLAATHRVVVISGDSETATARFREHPGVDEAFAGVPPEAKARVIDRLRADDSVVAMVGDGSNDAPALAAADVGIALDTGTRLAIDAADVVVTTDDIATVPDALSLLGAARRRVRENLGWAFLYNAIAIPLAIAGLINPLFAAVAMASSSLLVVGNSARDLDTTVQSRSVATSRTRAGAHTGNADE
jgi:Cu2+-exporting ATPase